MQLTAASSELEFNMTELVDHLDGVDSETLDARGLLDGWHKSLRQDLLTSSLNERSIVGVRFAVNHGACAEVDDKTVAGLLTGVMGWCAPRSLRFRLQDWLIGGSDVVTPLRRCAATGSDTKGSSIPDEHVELINELERRIPSLRARGALQLYTWLRDRVRRMDESEIHRLRHELATRLQDELAMALCTPFLDVLVSGCGRRDGVDASHIAASLASMGGNGALALLSGLSQAGYSLEGESTESTNFARCLSCPMCCLNDGVTPTANGAMRFSPQHAAAAAGQVAVYSWLREHQQTAHPRAEAMVFDAESVVEAKGQDATLAADVTSAGADVKSAAADVKSAAADDGGWPSTADAATIDGMNAASRCDIHTVRGDDVAADPRAFFEEYVRAAQPVVVRQLLAHDRALAMSKAAFGREALLGRLGSSTWEVGEIPYEGRYRQSTRAPMTLRAYVEEHLDACSTADGGRGCTSHPYVFAERFWKGARQVGVKNEKLGALPTWARVSGVRLGKGTQFYLGPASSGAPMHFHQAAVNVLYHGHKRWYVTPPAHAVFSMQPAVDWLHKELPRLRDANATLYQCDQRAGDVLVLPDLWGHLTVNLETSIGVAQEFSYA